MNEFFQRLKQRKLVQWTVAYVAAAFALLQGIDIIANRFDLPSQTIRLVILAMIVGFFVTLVLAWYHGERGAQRVSGTELLILALLLAIGGGLLWRVGGAAQTAIPHSSSPPAQVAPPNAPAATAVTEKSIAVLPFVNMSDDQANEYFSDGISEELLNLLAKVPQLQVAARTSSFSFKGKQIEIPEIARQLHVAHVLEGSVRKSGDRVRITAQLVRADEGYHVWSETYDRKLDDIFKIQDEIAGEVVKQLKVALLGGTAPTVRQTDPEAYALYLQARALGGQFTAEAFQQSDALYRQVLAIDPRYAPAWEGRARNFLRRGTLALVSNQEASTRAREAAEKALAIDPDYAPAHAVLGWLATYSNDLVGAATHYARALALDSSDLSVLRNAASFLWQLGRLDEALALSEVVTRRDPVNPAPFLNLGNFQLTAGRYDAAIGSYRTAQRLSPGSGLAHAGIGVALLLKGDAPAALAEFQQVTSDMRLPGLALAYHALGRTADSDNALEALIAIDEKNHVIACVHAYRGDADKAFESLEKALAYHNPGLSRILADKLLANLHSDPRWLPFLRKIGRAPEQLAKVEFKVTLPP